MRPPALLAALLCGTARAVPPATLLGAMRPPALLAALLCGAALAVPPASLMPTTLTLGSQIDDELGIGGSRTWTYSATTADPFTVTLTRRRGDCLLRVCNGPTCVTKDGTYYSSSEAITIQAGDAAYGGAGAAYAITAVGMGDKESAPVSACDFSVTLTTDGTPLVRPSPSSRPALPALFRDTTVTATTSGGVAFFLYNPTVAGALSFTARNLLAAGGDTIELSIGLAPPRGSGAGADEWAAFAVQDVAAGSIETAPLPTSSQFYLGRPPRADSATYYIRVAALGGAAGEAPFALRLEVDAAGAPSPTPSPSPAPAPAQPGTPLRPVEPLALDSDPVRDALRPGNTREWAFVAPTDGAFTVTAALTTGDVSLSVCGEQAPCDTSDGTTYYFSAESITISPGSHSYGGAGARCAWGG